MGLLSVKGDGMREEDGVGLAEHNCAACHQRKKKCCCSGEEQLRGEARQTRAPDRPPPVPPPEPEWRDLVTNMGTLALGDQQQQQQQQSLATARSRPKPTRSRSDQTFNHPGGKRTRDECFPSNLGPTLFASGSDDDDSAGLGAPPPLPPTLKRAKACSYSPTSSTVRKFSKRDENADKAPRQ